MNTRNHNFQYRLAKGKFTELVVDHYIKDTLGDNYWVEADVSDELKGKVDRYIEPLNKYIEIKGCSTRIDKPTTYKNWLADNNPSATTEVWFLPTKDANEDNYKGTDWKFKIVGKKTLYKFSLEDVEWAFNEYGDEISYKHGNDGSSCISVDKLIEKCTPLETINITDFINTHYPTYSAKELLPPKPTKTQKEIINDFF